jgi:hypothetical protein
LGITCEVGKKTLENLVDKPNIDIVVGRTLGLGLGLGLGREKGKRCLRNRYA